MPFSSAASLDIAGKAAGAHTHLGLLMRRVRDRHELGEDVVKPMRGMSKSTKAARKAAREMHGGYAPRQDKPATVERTVVKRRMKTRRKP